MSRITNGLVALALTASAAQGDLMDRFNEVNKITYLREAPGMDYWQTPSETKKLGTGDCEDMAFYLQDLLKQDGVKSEVKFGLSYNGARDLHAWVEAEHEGTIYVVDCTSKSMVAREAMPSTIYIDIPTLKTKEFAPLMKEYEQRLKLDE